jgi:hypothetical protein
MLALISTLMMISIPIFTVKAEETLIWSAYVYSDGTPVTSPVLETYMQYRIVAKEIFWYNYAADLAADAMYYTDSPPHWNWISFFPAPGDGSFLQINDVPVNWGPFSNGDTGHTYSIYRVGTGAAITFRLVDLIDGAYNNNHCHLPVEIYESPLCPGYTPGFWKHNIGVALGYNRGEYSAFRDGTKLTAAMLAGYATTVGVTLEEAYAAVSAKGNTEGQAQIRADIANAFNAVAGYDPFVD